MKKLQDQLKSISKALVVLSKKVETITKHVEKLQAKTKATAAKKATKKAPAKKAVRKKSAGKKAPAKKAAAKKTAARKKSAAQRPTVLESVFTAVSDSKAGAAISEIRAKTGLGARQLSNALYKLTKQGKIATAARGVYIKK